MRKCLRMYYPQPPARLTFEIAKDFNVMVNNIRSNLTTAGDIDDDSKRISLPPAVQKSFFDALGIIWMLELRIAFQNAVKEENIAK
jgi:hypothetical protein